MITNPSCNGGEEIKEQEHGGKFVAPSFEEELPDIGGAGSGPVGGSSVPQGAGLTDLTSYTHQSYGHGGHYNTHYGHYAGGGWQGQEYGGYYQGSQGGYYPSHYQGGGGYHQEWQHSPAMVLPPGPSPTGSNNSPSPHGFSDTNEGESNHHVISRSELKRPSPDSFLPHHTLSQQSSLHHQSVPKKPKVSKRRKKRDPNEPQKPVSAYALFFRDTQASIKMRNPNANFGEVSKIVAATWDSLDPDSKAAYKKRTEMAKKEYLRALAAYRANMVSKVRKCLKSHKVSHEIFLRSVCARNSYDPTHPWPNQRRVLLLWCVSMPMGHLESSNQTLGKDVMQTGFVRRGRHQGLSKLGEHYYHIK